MRLSTVIQMYHHFGSSLEEEPNCHRLIREDFLGCSGTTEEPQRLKPAMN